MNEIRKGFHKPKRGLLSNKALKSVNLTKSFSAESSSLLVKKRSPVETTTSTSSENHSSNGTHEITVTPTSCVRRLTTTKSVTNAAHHGRKKRNVATEDSHASDPHSSTSNETNSTATVVECIILPTSDSDFIKFQISLAILMSLFFVLAYLALNFCSRELFNRILNKIRKGSRKYMFRSVKSDN